MNTLSDSVLYKLKFNIHLTEINSSITSAIITSAIITGDAHNEIYGGVCSPVFQATPRIMTESLKNVIRSKNEYST
jgi:hypothetical protein